MRAGKSSPKNYTDWKLVLLLSTQPCFLRKWTTAWVLTTTRSIIIKPPSKGGAVHRLNFHCNLALINVLSSKHAGTF